MDKFLRPQVLDIDPNAQHASNSWRHWKQTFTNFLNSLSTAMAPLSDDDKLRLLTNYVSPNIYTYFSECSTFTEAIKMMDDAYIKVRSIIFARHELATRKQSEGENLDQYLHELKNLASYCDFKSVSAAEYQDEYTRDAFINGLRNSYIRQRLLERPNLDLKEAFKIARSLELAEEQSNAYSSSDPRFSASAAISDTLTIQGKSTSTETTPKEHSSTASTISHSKSTARNQLQRCYWCGGARHNRRFCPARNDNCHKCNSPGHWAKVCRGGVRSHPSKPEKATFATTSASQLLCGTTCAAPSCLSPSLVTIEVAGMELEALIDSGSSHSFIKTSVAKSLSIPVTYSSEFISLASSSCKAKICGYVEMDITIQGVCFDRAKFGLMDDLCADVLIGIDFLIDRGLNSVVLGNYHGERAKISSSPAKSSNSAFLFNEDSQLFKFLKPGCKPIATKSRHYSEEDRQFIASEVERLRCKGVIEECSSPWRAQVIVTKDGRHKRRMVVDYSRTINIYTELDAYPLPRIDKMANDLAKYSYFSTLDLEDAYYQVEIPQHDKPYTAFEANGRLFQFTKIPFGVTNGVAAFQKYVDRFIDENGLSDTFAYVDNWTVGGRTREEHDSNLERLMDAARRHGFKFNEKKCIYSVKEVNILGYSISHGKMRPDEERLKPLREIPLPDDVSSLRRVIGLFSYYSQWIKSFSDLIRPLVQSKSFPLSSEAEQAFQRLKSEIESAVLQNIDEEKPFVIETDASEHAIAATLNQCGRPVAFFSRTLNSCEQKHSSVEKEALAIVEAVRKWRHYLFNKHFTLITDQRSVSFMFNSSRHSKIKNDKIERWRLELACFSYDIIYRKGELNIPPDALSRVVSSSAYAATRVISSTVASSLEDYHERMCHPGVRRLHHFVRSRNLPFSFEEVKRVCKECPVCCRIKPQFFNRPESHLIKATQPWERLSIDFKGPIPSRTDNVYILSIVDEFSRFPFAFPCRSTDAQTVIRCFVTLFSIFGTPMFIHSDRGGGFVGRELRNWLHAHGVATSNSSPFHPTGNSQVERLNGTIWKHVQLALESAKLPVNAWESVLSDALHAIRSLLCTSTNCTPHERMFSHQRRGSSGSTLPVWLCSPGKVLLKRHVRSSKYEPLVTEVELIQSNPQYATVRMADGRESTVSVSDLAPVGVVPEEREESSHSPVSSDTQGSLLEVPPSTPPSPTELRRSTRERRPPVRLGYGENFEPQEGRMS